MNAYAVDLQSLNGEQRRVVIGAHTAADAITCAETTIVKRERCTRDGRDCAVWSIVGVTCLPYQTDLIRHPKFETK